MLFGRKKPGFVQVEEVGTEDMTEDGKPELLAYLTSLPEVEDEFGMAKVDEVTEDMVEETPASESQKLADYIRIRSKGISLTSQDSLRKEIDHLDTLLEELKTDETCQDIRMTKGNQDCYYYSSDFMSDNYAMISALVEEKDLAVTIANMVRFNCKTYPVPTPMSYFEKHPYFVTEPQIERAVSVMGNREEFHDIKLFSNNNQVKYFYSDAWMSERYAKALAEDDLFTD